MAERLSSSRAEQRGLEQSAKRGEELRELLVEERDAARSRAEHADERAAEMARGRGEAQAHVGTLQARVAALEAEQTAAVEATRVSAERLRSETGELRSHVEYAEARCKEAQLQQQLIHEALEAERSERIKLEAQLARSEERLLEEQVIACVITLIACE